MTLEVQKVDEFDATSSHSFVGFPQFFSREILIVTSRSGRKSLVFGHSGQSGAPEQNAGDDVDVIRPELVRGFC